MNETRRRWSNTSTFIQLQVALRWQSGDADLSRDIRRARPFRFDFIFWWWPTEDRDTGRSNDTTTVGQNDTEVATTLLPIPLNYTFDGRQVGDTLLICGNGGGPTPAGLLNLIKITLERIRDLFRRADPSCQILNPGTLNWLFGCVFRGERQRRAASSDLETFSSCLFVIKSRVRPVVFYCADVTWTFRASRLSRRRSPSAPRAPSPFSFSPHLHQLVINKMNGTEWEPGAESRERKNYSNK